MALAWLPMKKKQRSWGMREQRSSKTLHVREQNAATHARPSFNCERTTRHSSRPGRADCHSRLYPISQSCRHLPQGLRAQPSPAICKYRLGRVSNYRGKRLDILLCKLARHHRQVMRLNAALGCLRRDLSERRLIASLPIGQVADDGGKTCIAQSKQCIGRDLGSNREISIEITDVYLLSCSFYRKTIY